MANTWTHIFAALALALMALIIHISIRNDANVRLLDTARYYTMTREKGDVNGALLLLDSEQSWLSQGCRAAVNQTTSNACITERTALRNAILDRMKCFSYSSQVCSFLRNITSALVQTRAYGGTNFFIGRALVSPPASMGTITFREIFRNAISNAPYLFHNSYRTVQSDDFYVLRTILYSLVVFSILGNLLVHYFDQNQNMTWSRRLLLRILLFSLTTLLIMVAFLINNSGSVLTVLLGIWAPALVILLYYEAFLDASITRPWYVRGKVIWIGLVSIL
jgi:hypothetical protein